MQYVRSIGGSAYSAWQSINPATLSGAIDVIVVEQDDQSLACSPFHIRFGKWRLLRPFEKKVEFKINGVKQDYPMKLGEGGEAFFVFETQESVPEALQTSPLVSPATSPELRPDQPLPSLQEPDPFELEAPSQPREGTPRRTHTKSPSEGLPVPPPFHRAKSEDGNAGLKPLTQTTSARERPLSADLSELRQSVPRLERNVTDSDLPTVKAAAHSVLDGKDVTSRLETGSSPLKNMTERSSSPPPPSVEDAKERARNLSTKLWRSNISNQVTDSGDLMLDMNGYKSSDGEALHAEVIARQLLSEEIDGPYDIGALIGADEKGNVWIYSSEEAKEAAGKKAAEGLGSYNPGGYLASDAISDPGYHSDDTRSDSNVELSHNRRDSDSALGIASGPSSPSQHVPASGDPNKNYAKTLRLTSDQLKAMDLKSGANTMSFTVNRATCTATLWYWKHDVPIVISDIDGTITKSDVLGHVLNTIGRDWTHPGVAKLYTDIASNGYNFLYLTSRSVGQADTTRNYLDGIVQEGYRLPKGPVILSPDRTIAALRREVYLRKPEIFKMACLRDIMTLFSGAGGTSHAHEDQSAGLYHTISQGGLGPNRGKQGSPFYAGFGNRLTDALSYRSVNIPSTRIFTINSNSEITLDLLSLNKYRTAYSTMREVVDHFFPPVGLLIKGGGEEFTDFNYWRDKPLDIVDFTDSESEAEDNDAIDRALVRAQTAETGRGSLLSEDEAGADEMLESFMSDPRMSLDESLSEVLEDGEGVEMMSSSMLQEEEGGEDGDDEFEVGDDYDDGEEPGGAHDHVRADRMGEGGGSDEGPRTPQPVQGEWGAGSDGEEDEREATPRRSKDLPEVRVR